MCYFSIRDLQQICTLTPALWTPHILDHITVQIRRLLHVLFTLMEVMKNSDETQVYISTKQAYSNALLANDIWFLY